MKDCPKNVQHAESHRIYPILQKKHFPIWAYIGNSNVRVYMTLDENDKPIAPLTITMDNERHLLPKEASPGMGGEAKVCDYIFTEIQLSYSYLLHDSSIIITSCFLTSATTPHQFVASSSNFRESITQTKTVQTMPDRFFAGYLKPKQFCVMKTNGICMIRVFITPMNG